MLPSFSLNARFVLLEFLMHKCDIIVHVYLTLDRMCQSVLFNVCNV